MKHQAVKSSNIKSAGYDPKTKTMEITFKPRGPQARKGPKETTYVYQNVGEEHFKKMISDPSPGGYHYAHIKDKFPSRKK